MIEKAIDAYRNGLLSVMASACPNQQLRAVKRWPFRKRSTNGVFGVRLLAMLLLLPTIAANNSPNVAKVVPCMCATLNHMKRVISSVMKKLSNQRNATLSPLKTEGDFIWKLCFSHLN